MIYSNNNIINFYNIKFHNWTYNSIIKKISKGGYLCAPAAFPLCEIRKEKKYFQSLKNSKINLFDSGYFCILLRIFKRIKVKKFSGFLFLLKFLNDKSFKKKKILFVDPTINDSKLNSILLAKKRFKNFFNYVAPIYNSKKSYQDKKLFDLINKIRPKFIVINISGLKQEYLAYVIIKKIKFKLSIFCLGGAISFMTRTQAPITPFFDKHYMGWFIRIIFSPRIFIRRTIRSISLIKFFF